MNKDEFITALQDFQKKLTNISRKVESAPGNQVQKTELKSSIQEISTAWFEVFDSPLRHTYSLPENIVQKYHTAFGQLLELVVGRPSKRNVVAVLKGVCSDFSRELFVPIQKYTGPLKHYPWLEMLSKELSGIEQEYMKEAIGCATAGFRRAAVILGWCAAVDRLHSYIEREGFPKFNEASVQMAAISTGRYKRCNKKFDIHNLSEFRMSVFDNDLLWVLEFMGAIDANEHERLEICFTMRNTCAHPGKAILSEQNLESFFSDLELLVFRNPKFAKINTTQT